MAVGDRVSQSFHRFGATLGSRHGPSTSRPGAQKPSAGKCRVAAVGMTVCCSWVMWWQDAVASAAGRSGEGGLNLI
jgi:hypothetical protein